MRAFKLDQGLIRVLLAATALAGLGRPQVVWAQDTGGSSPSAAAKLPVAAKPSDQTAKLDEIVVTVQRRSENLQKVPLSVSAFSPRDLKRLSITSPKALQFSTPGLTFPEDNGTVNPYIRGRGTGYSGSGLEGSVAVYIDQVYEETQFGTGGLFDVSQVQVLKGPQGTLYGRNATGGAILIATNDPTHELGGYVESGYGNLGMFEVQGVLNLPITDKLSVRLAGREEQRDGYITDVVDGSKHGAADRYQLRGKILWAPTTNFTANLTVEYQRTNSDYLRDQLIDGTGTPTTLGFYQTAQSPRNPDNLGGENNVKVFSSTLHLGLNLDKFKIESITGYRNTSLSACVDNDDTYQKLDEFCIGHAATPGHIYQIDGAYDHTVSQELRLTSKFDGFFNFLIGGNYQRSEDRFPATIEGALFGPLLPTFDNFVNLTNYSVYGEGYFNITKALKLTVGGRYNVDERDLKIFNNPDVAIGFGIPPAFLPATISQQIKFKDFTPRVVLDYDVGNANYYVSFNQGFKSGGFNVPTELPQTPLMPEKIDGYEAGAKFKMFENRLALDIAYFHTISSNVQVASIDLQTNSVIQQNAAGVKADGFETTLNFAASNNLKFQIGAAYLHSRFTSFPNAAVYAVDPTTRLLEPSVENLKGFATTNSPDFTANANVTYNTEFWDGWATTVTLSGRYSTAYDLQAGAGGPLRADRQKAFGIINLTGDITPPGKHFSFSWYINNLLEQHYYDIIQTGGNIGGSGVLNGAAGGTYGGPGLPRTFGAAVRYTF